MESDQPPPELIPLNVLPLAILFTQAEIGYISIEVILALLLVFLSAMFSGSEVAFFSMTPKDLHEIKNDEDPKNDKIYDLLKKPRYLLSTILVANNLINIAFIILTYFIVKQFLNCEDCLYNVAGLSLSAHIIEGGINLIVDVFILMVFCEIMPKIYAANNKRMVAEFMAGPLFLLRRILYPINYMMVSSSAFVEKRIKTYSDFDLQDLDHAIEMTLSKNSSPKDAEILKSIVHFGNTTAKQILKPRTQLYSLDDSWNFSEMMEYVRQAGYSRLPVFHGDIDHITGVLHVKDLLPHLNENENFQWNVLVREAMFIPETKKIDDLLREFQANRKHLSIVVDEYGGTSGIVTLEDIIEEILGEIKDEFDEEDDFQYKKIDENTFIFEGKTLIHDLCKFLEIEIDTFDEVKGDSDTIAGLILEIAGRMPGRNEEITYKDFQFKVMNWEKNRIKRVLLSMHES